jgi:DNA-binding MarR family transcriptional regulator
MMSTIEQINILSPDEADRNRCLRCLAAAGAALSPAGEPADLVTELQLSPAQCHVLHLIEPGRPISMGQPPRRWRAMPRMHRLVDRLESRGLVRRRPSAADRRVKVLISRPPAAAPCPAARSHDLAAGDDPAPLRPRATDAVRILTRLLE